MADEPVMDMPVSWIVEGFAIQASLTIPSGEGPFPAIVMVAGSGPTDRNWNSPLINGSHGSAALLARELTEAGFVTLRYDKGASGANVKEYLTHMMGRISMQSHREELAGGVRLLAERADVDRSHLFALTNSEGCIHALNYQLQSPAWPLAGLLLTSAPARPVGVVGREQIVAQLSTIPNGEPLIAIYDQVIEDFTAGREVTIADSLPAGLRGILKGITNPYNQPFARELWVMDAAQLISQVTCPALVLLGKKDIQVNWQRDGMIFDALAERLPNLEIAYAENANHVLKHEVRPLEQLNGADALNMYNSDQAHMDGEVVEIILNWLGKQVL